MQKRSLRGFARALVKEAADKSPSALATLMREAVSLLREQGHMHRWRELEREIQAAWKDVYGVSKISVVTAHELTETAQKQLEKVAGGAELSVVVNPRLIGGAVVRADERRLDGTVLGALTRLKQTLLA